MHFSEFIAFIDSAPAGITPAQPDAITDPSSIIGSAVPRIDGKFKTTGTARYAGGLRRTGLFHHRQRHHPFHRHLRR
jgi:hypothetical protein